MTAAKFLGALLFEAGETMLELERGQVSSRLMRLMPEGGLAHGERRIADHGHRGERSGKRRGRQPRPKTRRAYLNAWAAGGRRRPPAEGVRLPGGGPRTDNRYRHNPVSAPARLHRLGRGPTGALAPPAVSRALRKVPMNIGARLLSPALAKTESQGGR
jgi:hypothetical protein